MASSVIKADIKAAFYEKEVTTAASSGSFGGYYAYIGDGYDPNEIAPSRVIGIVPIGAVNKNANGDVAIIGNYRDPKMFALASDKQATYICRFLVIYI